MNSTYQNKISILLYIHNNFIHKYGTQNQKLYIITYSNNLINPINVEFREISYKYKY